MHHTHTNEPVRVVLYSHDSQGLGHVRRNLAIAHHIARTVPELTGRPVAGLLVSGLPQASVFPLPTGFDWVFIPSIRKAQGEYASRSLGAPTSLLVELRSQLLHASLLSFNPDVVIIDRHIFGVMRELQQPLAALRERNPFAHVVLGLREVLDTPQVAYAEWYKNGDPADLRSVIDSLWIYGDPSVHNPVEAGEIPEELADKAKFTGYLALGRGEAEPTQPLEHARPFILTTAGGGEDGATLLETLVRARVPEGFEHLVVTGPQLAAETFNLLVQLAAPGTRVLHSLPGLSHYIEQAAAVVCMGGYNTTNEVLASSTPALIVPRETPRTEQLIRAQAMHSHGVVDYCRTQDLTVATAEDWLNQAVHRRVDRTHIERDGLWRTATLVAEIVVGSHRPTPPQEDSCPA
ncbi:glycosyltransferase [Rothia sp. SD9660Na]|uniref:glycosyltransferase family protein n=1 Tax=Rothia sp. SD9660Na TaxID=3047030 RepID=UPI0024BBCBE2|nr:glycosyltransferase [Rothia sp. SD9660Na]WHS49747.1 glycosyltransferase [Rothia sp. SD9660Na]